MHEESLKSSAGPQDAMEEIERLPGVKEVALFGNGLHVVVTDAAAAGRSITEAAGRERLCR